MSFLTGLVIALLLATAAPTFVHAQDEAGTGLITLIDGSTRTLTLETTGGLRTVVVAPGASLRGDGRALRWTDLAPGDAVAYRASAGRVTRLEVACQFWAVPSGR